MFFKCLPVLILSQLLNLGTVLADERKQNQTQIPEVVVSVNDDRYLLTDRKNVLFGVYDPNRTFRQRDDMRLEHMFVFWQSLDKKNLRQKIRYAYQRGRIMMLTVEPFTRAANWRDGGDKLFKDITQGKFDSEIVNVCSELGRLPTTSLIRWGHEMEDPTGRYPWARHDAQGYKLAFRYFARTCRKYAPKAKFIWSPKGEKNLADYYPGDDHVDIIGVSLWGLEKMDIDYYGGRRAFRSTFNEKYNRVSRFGKPVIVAELGVSGTKAYRKRWFHDLFKSLNNNHEFKLLRAVVLFNDKEPHHWPKGYGSPDWRVSQKWFSFLKQTSHEMY